MSQQFTCTVNQAGSSVEGSETPNPQTYLNLTDLGGSFTGTWFFAADKAKREMLGVALAAVSTQNQVSAFVDPPNAGNNPLTQCYTLHIVSS